MVPKPNFKRRKPKRKKRGQFSKETREKIIERENGLCRLCNAKGTEIHHCKFKSQGGRGVFSNGLLLCAPCHRKVHQNAELALKLRNYMKAMYGPDYFRDEWDI